MSPRPLLALTLLLLGAWTVPPRPAGDGHVAAAQYGGGARKDYQWVPQTYDLSTAGSGAAGTQGLSGPGVAQGCTPNPARVAEGSCENGSRSVTFADGCGGRQTRVESCISGAWGWYYRGTADRAATTAVVQVACAEPGTGRHLADSACGPRLAGVDQCLVGPAGSATLPRCGANVRMQVPPDFQAFWGAGAAPICPYGC